MMRRSRTARRELSMFGWVNIFLLFAMILRVEGIRLTLLAMFRSVRNVTIAILVQWRWEHRRISW